MFCILEVPFTVYELASQIEQNCTSLLISVHMVKAPVVSLRRTPGAFDVTNNANYYHSMMKWSKVINSLALIG